MGPQRMAKREPQEGSLLGRYLQRRVEQEYKENSESRQRRREEKSFSSQWAPPKGQGKSPIPFMDVLC